MLTIRFARVGKKNRAQFKIMLQEHTVAPGGRHIEILGSHDPHLKQTVLKEDRIKYWISKGAQPSDTVYNLFVSKGVIEGKKRSVKLPEKKKEEVSEEAAAEQLKEVKEEESKEEIKAEEPEVKAEEAATPDKNDSKEEKKEDKQATSKEEPEKAKEEK